MNAFTSLQTALRGMMVRVMHRSDAELLSTAAAHIDYMDVRLETARKQRAAWRDVCRAQVADLGRASMIGRDQAKHIRRLQSELVDTVGLLENARSDSQRAFNGRGAHDWFDAYVKRDKTVHKLATELLTAQSECNIWKSQAHLDRVNCEALQKERNAWRDSASRWLNAYQELKRQALHVAATAHVKLDETTGMPL